MKYSENILFSGIDENDCRRMIECFNAKIVEYKQGDTIFSYMRPSRKTGIIISGRAVSVKYDINGNRTILEQLEKNDITGDMFNFSKALISGVEVICETPVTIMLIDNSEFTKRCSNACACHSRLVENMLELVSEKAAALSERVDVLSGRTIEDKLMTYLRILQNRNSEGTEATIPFSITALSDYLCVNRSALQREIARLSKEGVLEISKKKFRLNI
ncbi:MAG: Crp/Fnr family transcriptional regulator [Ruminococcus sp.]|nr:Crp/Fnr family transcriptional regulator [Ruminococcus sp.]